MNFNIEFYQDHSGVFGRKLFARWNGKWEDFDELTPEQIEIIFTHVCHISSKAKQALLALSKHIAGKKELLKQFIFCNWSSLDQKFDIGDDILHFEKIECPHKNSGKCPYKGIGVICIKH